MTARRVVAINAGLGDPSSTRLLVDRLVDSVVTQAHRSAEEIEVEVIDLRDLAAQIAQSVVAGFALGDVAEALRSVYAADGLIAATPVFNASFSGLFKSFVDLFDVEKMRGKPVLIAATGGSPRHSMVLDHALRPMFSYLRAVVLPTGVYAAAEDWADASVDGLGARIDRASRELLVAVDGARPRKQSGAPVAAREGDTSGQREVEQAGIATFARLLGGQ